MKSWLLNSWLLNGEMKKVKPVDSDIYELRRGNRGFVLAIAGVGFLLPCLLANLGLDPNRELGLGLVDYFGAILILAAIAIMLFRHGVVIDRGRRLYTRWAGFVVPMKRAQSSLDEYERVTLGCANRISWGKTETVYPVGLAGPDAAAITVDDEKVDYYLARRFAEDIARFLGFPLADSSSGTLVVREATHLDESLREQVQRTGEQITLPPPPPGLRSKFVAEGSGLTIDIPGIGLGKMVTVYRVVFGAIVVLFMASAIVSILSPGNPVPFTVGLIALVVFFFIPLWFLGNEMWMQFRGPWVRVSPTELELRQGRKVTTIPAAELEELLVIGDPDPLVPASEQSKEQAQPDGETAGGVQPASGDPQQQLADLEKTAGLRGSITRLRGGSAIHARSDSRTVTFGQGLDPEELRYLYAMIKKVLATGTL